MNIFEACFTWEVTRESDFLSFFIGKVGEPGIKRGKVLAFDPLDGTSSLICLTKGSSFKLEVSSEEFFGSNTSMLS